MAGRVHDRGTCMARGVHGKGCAWQGGMHGRVHALQRTVRILLECILVAIILSQRSYLQVDWKDRLCSDPGAGGSDLCGHVGSRRSRVSLDRK